MENERRRYPRLEADMKLSLVFDDQGGEVFVNVKNLCGGGVLMLVEEEGSERITPSDVGRAAHLHTRGGFALEASQGKILRCTEKEGKKYVALVFNEDKP